MKLSKYFFFAFLITPKINADKIKNETIESGKTHISNHIETKKDNFAKMRERIYIDIKSAKIHPLAICMPISLLLLYIIKSAFNAITEETVRMHDNKLRSISSNEIYPLCTVLEEEDFAKISSCENIHKVIDACNVYHRQNPNSALIKLSKLKRTLNWIKTNMSKFFRILLKHRLSYEAKEVLANEKLLNERIDSLLKIVTSNIE
jgi:hypothetical protein